MTKIKVTADAVLSILLELFKDESINSTINDIGAPSEWLGKTVSDILNVEYYTFKHRPASTQTVINKMLEETGQTNNLLAVNRSFCLLSLGNVERLYSKDDDMSVISASLTYYIQSSKIKLLEYMIEDCNILTSGLRIPVEINSQIRRAVIIFGRPSVGDIQTASNFGETALVDVPVNMILYPDAASYADYDVSFDFTDENGVSITGCGVPLTAFTAVNTMTQNAMPLGGNERKVGCVNLSCANSFVLVFDGYNNPFVNFIAGKALASDIPAVDNNQSFAMTITRNGNSYRHNVIIKDHQITVNADTSNETHTLALVARGI